MQRQNKLSKRVVRILSVAVLLERGRTHESWAAVTHGAKLCALCNDHARGSFLQGFVLCCDCSEDDTRKGPFFVVMLRRKVCSKLFSVSNGAEWIVKSPLLRVIAIVLGDRTHVVAENRDK